MRQVQIIKNIINWLVLLHGFWAKEKHHGNCFTLIDKKIYDVEFKGSCHTWKLDFLPSKATGLLRLVTHQPDLYSHDVPCILGSTESNTKTTCLSITYCDRFPSFVFIANAIMGCILQNNKNSKNKHIYENTTVKIETQRPLVHVTGCKILSNLILA